MFGRKAQFFNIAVGKDFSWVFYQNKNYEHLFRFVFVVVITWLNNQYIIYIHNVLRYQQGLTHYNIVMPYGDLELGHHNSRQWLGA